MMNEETRLELIKAFAFGMPLEDIANEASISIEEAEQFRVDNADEIDERRRIGGTYEE